jgi:predicted PurR-regulated permease PerM
MGCHPITVGDPMSNDAEATVNLVFESLWRYTKRVVFWTLLTIALVYCIGRVRSVIASVFVAVLLTYVLLPGVDWLCKKRVWFLKARTQRLLATVTIFVLFLAFVSVAVSLIITPFRQEITDFVANFGKYTDRLGQLAEKAWIWYAKSVPADIKEFLGKLDYSGLTDKVSSYLQRAARFTSTSLGVAIELILIPVLAFYFAFDYKSLAREFYGTVPVKRRREVLRMGRHIGDVLQNYIFGQLILCVIAGVLTGIFLSIVGLPYEVVLALFSGITRAIPIIGPVVSGIPIVLVGLLNMGPAMAVYLLIFVVVMHFAESKFIMPHLLGDRLHLHPATVIIVLLIGAEFFGLIGMFVAVPVAAIAREIVRTYYIKPCRRVEVGDS